MSPTNAGERAARVKSCSQRGKHCIQIGGVGAFLAAICCFSPLLVVVLGALGLGMVTKYLDLILLPTLFICLGLLVYGLQLRKTATHSEAEGGDSK